MRERGKHVGVVPSGQLKPALATGREIDGQFGIRLLVSIAPIIEQVHEISNNLTSVDSDKPVQCPFKLRNSK